MWLLNMGYAKDIRDIFDELLIESKSIGKQNEFLNYIKSRIAHIEGNDYNKISVVYNAAISKDLCSVCNGRTSSKCLKCVDCDEFEP